MNKKIKLNINGDLYELFVEPRKTLLEVLRNELRLTGTKEGCEVGECGVCTVLLNGLPVRSCLIFAVDVEDYEITTIEGISNGKILHPIQEAFIKYGAIQCGFCTPGMILTAKSLLDRNPNPEEQEVREAIAGNLCRCTGYAKIIEAIMSVHRLS